jgi:hypothetical protein
MHTSKYSTVLGSEIRSHVRKTLMLRIVGKMPSWGYPDSGPLLNSYSFSRNEYLSLV